MIVHESFAAKRITDGQTVDLSSSTRIGGFACDVDGTLSLTINGTLVLTGMTITNGMFLPLPFELAGTSEITIAGGGSGCLLVI